MMIVPTSGASGSNSWLAADTYAGHFANVWRAWLLEQATSEQTPFFAPGLTAWFLASA